MPLARELTQLLKRYEKSQREDPFANPIQHLALELSRRLADGKLDIRDIEGLIGHLTIEGFSHRAARLGRYLGETGPEANDAALRALFQGLTRDAKGGIVPFAAFRRRVESEAFGAVFTAHPTFSLSGALMADLATLAAGRTADGAPLTEAAKSALLDRAAAVEHRPDEDLSLAREHALSLDAIANARAALGRAWGILLDVAREAYPEDWRGLTPRLVTLASWVGYDLDGRSDIRWTDSLHKRLLVQAAQLDHYLAEVRAIRSAVPRGAADLLETLDLLESRVALAIAQIRDEVAAFAVADPGSAAGREQIRVISQRIHAGQALRLTESASLIAIVDRALERTDDPDLSRRFCLLRAELATHGLGAAHTHVRINATQVHNAIRKAVGMVSDPNDPRYRQSYLDRLNALLDAVEPMSVNFGSLLAERTSVKRLFMLLAQMLKYNDRSAPIRFLIAESESAFTCLTALYYARLFGVDGMVDISPLFETEKALENGSRIIEQLLENPHYRDYVRRRGRVCVQTGYSDAGRYLGQTPAGASIERLRLRLIRVIAKAGLPDVQLLIFDTHGEIDRPRLPSRRHRRPPVLCRPAGDPGLHGRAGRRLQAGGQLPGRRRLPVLRPSRPGLCGGRAHPAARADGGRRHPRRSVLRRGVLHPRVLHHGEGVPGPADGKPRLRRAAAGAGPEPAVPVRQPRRPSGSTRTRASWITPCRRSCARSRTTRS